MLWRPPAHESLLNAFMLPCVPYAVVMIICFPEKHLEMHALHWVVGFCGRVAGLPYVGRWLKVCPWVIGEPWAIEGLLDICGGP